MKRHVLPGEHHGDVAWFERLNPFEKQETRRQVTFKRSHWSTLEDGVWSKRPTYQYPHILSDDNVEKAFFPPLANEIIRYLAGEEIALHSEILNLRSSQAACLNILFPLKMDLERAADVLGPALPDVHRVTDIAFEYTGPYSATKWMGEPTGGKRGQNRTSIDAAIWWENGAGRKRLTFAEFKYTEKQLGTCGGYGSKGNKHRENCRNLNIQTERPQDGCYLENGLTGRTCRRYWEHLAEGGISLQRFGNVKGCPFRGPFYQLMRQYLLAAHCMASYKELASVDVILLGFRGNKSLHIVPPEVRHLGDDVATAWNTVLKGIPKLRQVDVADLSSLIPSTLQEWRDYLKDRYGI